MTTDKLPAGCGEADVTDPGDRLVAAPVGRTGPTGVGRTWTVALPYLTPPLTANQRLHHMARASLVRQVRADTGWLVKAAKVPRLPRCRVGLYYVPKTAGRRDEDNLVPTLKAACDAIVDAGVVPDDTPSYMEKLMPVIEPARPGSRPGSRLWLVITELPAHNPIGAQADE